ncbi:MAG: thiamine phosphate synthase [Gemmatimonadota bacterium]
MTFPVLHLITMDRDARHPGSLDTIRALCSRCGPSLAVHLRIRDLNDAELLDVALAVREIADGSGSWCVVNGRVDVALGARAHAVQLGKGSLPVHVARGLLPSAVLIGASVHDREMAELRVREGCDYLVLGTMYTTGTHLHGLIGGPQLLRRCTEAVSEVPIVAIGGIDRTRVAEIVAGGASGIAVNRAVWGNADPSNEAQKLVSILEDARAGRSDSAPREGTG